MVMTEEGIMDNRTIAQRLLSHARELEGSGSNLYRVKAYRRAAETIEGLTQAVSDIVVKRGRKGLEALPGIGSHLAFTVERLVQTGELRGMIPEKIDPAQRLDNLAGVGAGLARRIEERLGVTTIAGLQEADRQGRLDELAMGPQRLQKLREALTSHQEESQRIEIPASEPSVAELLAVDQDYREHVQAQRLPAIAPHPFSANNDAWLPLFSMRRNGWRFRAQWSHTAVAHRMKTTRDWVAIRYSNDAETGQRTVVTETHGDLAGLRVVRGRERECRVHYRQTANAG
jgi:DNA polymerase (family X)